MKNLLGIFSLLLLLSFFSCGGKKDKGPDLGLEAAKVAKQYYDTLVHGKYDVFLHSELRPGKMPDGYKQQLIANLKLFIEKRKEEHKGIDSISVASGTFSAKDSMANAFLLMHFSDSTSEQIVVPMVKKNGIWLMR